MLAREPRGIDRFVDRALVARGGASTVERALDPKDNARVAIKRCIELEGPRADALTREGALLSVLAHPALAAYVDHGVDQGYAYVVTRWIDGPSLAERIASGPLATHEFISLAQRLASALEALHAAGFVHGDLSPNNVLLADGAAREAVLIDPSTPGFITPAFAAPEVLRGAYNSSASDLYALGAVLRACANGTDAPDGADRAPALPAAIASLLHALVDEQPARRPTARMLLAALDQIELSSGSSARAPERGPSPSKLIAAPLRGRGAELLWLDAERDHAHDHARVALIRAPMGIGKSALLRHWLVRRPLEEQTLWANARGRGATFGLLDALIDSALAAHSASDDPLLDLADRCAATANERAAIVALFAEVQRKVRAAQPPPIVLVARSDPAMMNAQLEWAIDRLLRVELARAPLTVVIDDAHEADPSSLRVLGACVARARGPLLVVIAGRSFDERDPLASLARSSLALAPLDDATATQVVHDSWPDASERDVHAVLERAEGCPLFIEQLARQRTYDSAPVAEVIRRRVESRLPLERAVLAVAAMLGASFSVRAAQVVCADIASAGAVELAVAQLEIAGFLQGSADGGLACAGALVRDAALSGPQPEPVRARALHWLSARGEDDAALAVLADAAGERDVAAMRYLAAARRALMGGDFASAVHYAQGGLRCAPVALVAGALDSVQAHALGWVGRWRDASEGAARALSLLAPGSEDWVRAASTRCFALFELGELDGFLAIIDELIDTEPSARAYEPLAWAFSAASYALSASFSDAVVCRRLAEAAARLAQRSPSPRVLGSAARVRAEVSRAIDGALGPAHEAIVEAETQLALAGDELGAIYTRGLRARYRFVAGDWAGALALFEQADVEAERLRATSVRLYLRVCRADVLLRVRRIDEALGEALSILELPGIASRTMIRAQALRVAAEAHLAHRDLREAVEHASAAAACLTSDCAERANGAVVLALALEASGAPEQALAAARDAHRMTRSARPVVVDEFGASALYARLLAERGAIDESSESCAIAEQTLASCARNAGLLRPFVERSSLLALRTHEAIAALERALARSHEHA